MEIEPTLADLSLAVSYTERPDPVSPRQWADLRIARCLAVLEHCHGGRATWQTLHVVDWALGQSSILDLNSFLSGAVANLDRPVVRFDPALDRAVDRAVGLGLVTRDAQGSRISASGLAALEVVRESGAIRLELTQLDSLRRKITSKQVNEVLSWRTR